MPPSYSLPVQREADALYRRGNISTNDDPDEAAIYIIQLAERLKFERLQFAAAMAQTSASPITFDPLYATAKGANDG